MLIISAVHVARIFTVTGLLLLLLLLLALLFFSTAVQFYDPHMTYLHFDWLFVLLRRNPQSDYRQRRLPVVVVVVGGGLCSDTGRPSVSLCVRFIRNADDPPDHNEQNLPGETVALISDRDLTFVNNV